MKGLVVAGLVLVLGVTVVAIQLKTGFFNQASGLEKTYEGKIERVNPCVQGNLCFKLGTKYLLARQGWFYATGPYLEPFVGKNVTVSGWQVARTSGKSFILVKSVTLLPESTPILTPTKTPVDEPIDYPITSGARRCQTDNDCIEHRVCNPGVYCSSRPNQDFGPCESGYCKKSCRPRPACLDEGIVGCNLAVEPPGGWCPSL